MTINYGQLLDEKAVVRTGQTLKEAIKEEALRGAVQPYVDPYSILLEHALEIISGPDSTPYHNVVDLYPPGSKQPAWVAIFRGGRICVVTDNNKSVRVFLLGNDPKTAYEKNYPLIRHCLRGLLPDDGSELSVEVYAYRNVYPRSELELKITPYRFTASSFPPPADKIPLDLIGLKNFFFEGGQLEGAILDRKEGLILLAKRGGIQTIARHPVSYSDLAVAYRAVFHAGDNPAFVSLDPHPDPTKVKVSFGGFLEDTRIGEVVLEADKRFKTISTGLDPNSYLDIRKETRSFVPSFFTVSERDLLPRPGETSKEWEATRFWFYPDLIELETDPNFEYVKIINPQFMADAERSRQDFTSKEEFERLKKTTLSPSIRKCIEHLNQNYEEYTNVYPEIKELNVVGRIMGICSWLFRASPDWLDLDSLLSIDLPECRTERERTRMLAVTYVSYLSTENLEDKYIVENSKVVYLTPILDKKVEEYFNDWIDVAEFLCFANNVDKKYYREFEAEAKKIYEDFKTEKVKKLIKTENDLNALADFAATKIGISSPRLINALKAGIEEDKAELARLKEKINEVKEKLKSATREEIASLSKEYNKLVKEHNSLVSSLKRDHEILRQFQVRSPVTVRITGGVELGPKYFKIKKTDTSSELQLFKEISKEAEVEWGEVKDKGQWIKSRAGQGFSFNNYIPKYEWTTETSKRLGDESFLHLGTPGKQNYWFSKNNTTGDWQDLLQIDEATYQERKYEAATRTILISVFKDNKYEDSITGRMISPGRIVFSKYTGHKPSLPRIPPEWWIR